MMSRRLTPLSEQVLHALSTLRGQLPATLTGDQIRGLHTFADTVYDNAYAAGHLRAQLEFYQQDEANRRAKDDAATAAATPAPLCRYPHTLLVAGDHSSISLTEGDYVRLSWGLEYAHDTLEFRDGDWFVAGNLVLIRGRRVELATRGFEEPPAVVTLDGLDWSAWRRHGDHAAIQAYSVRDPARPQPGDRHGCGSNYSEHGWFPATETGIGSILVCPGVYRVSQVRINGHYLIKKMDS